MIGMMTYINEAFRLRDDTKLKHIVFNQILKTESDIDRMYHIDDRIIVFEQTKDHVNIHVAKIKELTEDYIMLAIADVNNIGTRSRGCNALNYDNYLYNVDIHNKLKHVFIPHDDALKLLEILKNCHSISLSRLTHGDIGQMSASDMTNYVFKKTYQDSSEIVYKYFEQEEQTLNNKLIDKMIQLLN